MKRPCAFNGDAALSALASFLALALVVAFFWMVFTIGSARGQTSVIKTPAACARLAAQFGFAASPTYSREEVKVAISHLDFRMMLVKDARDCRAALKRSISG
jgi:hypothetical protein